MTLPVCPLCGQRAQWQITPDKLACDRDFARQMRAVIADSDGFTPPVPTLLGGAR